MSTTLIYPWTYYLSVREVEEDERNAEDERTKVDENSPPRENESSSDATRGLFVYPYSYLRVLCCEIMHLYNNYAHAAHSKIIECIKGVS